MSGRKITVDAAKLDAEIEILNNTVNSYLAFWRKVLDGIGSMINGMDPVLQRNIGSKMDSAMSVSSSCSQTLMGALRALRNCKETYEAVDEYLAKEYTDWLPEDVREHYASVIESSSDESSNSEDPSSNVQFDESIYNQTSYSEFMEYYDYNYDGVLDWINTGCVITSCAYVLTCMGIPTTPLEAFERSGGCGAVYNAISQNKAYITMDQPVSKLTQMAIESKNNPNISNLMLRVNGNTHTVVLKDIELDGNGNISKYIIFDPYGGVTKEYSNLSEINVYNFDYYTRA